MITDTHPDKAKDSFLVVIKKKPGSRGVSFLRSFNNDSFGQTKHRHPSWFWLVVFL
jgi:hypothetical protein